MNKNRSYGRVAHLIKSANKFYEKEKKHPKVDGKHTLLIMDCKLKNDYQGKGYF